MRESIRAASRMTSKLELDVNGRFYEKVIKSQADVAALLIFFFRNRGSPVAWRAVKGVARKGTFILTLYRDPRHFIIELGTSVFVDFFIVECVESRLGLDGFNDGQRTLSRDQA